jgi:hypothetical protein
MGKLDDVCEGGEVAQLHVFIAWDVVGSADGGEHLRLLDGIDSEVGFEIEVKVEHVDWVACFFGDDCEDLLFDGVIGGGYG